MSTVHYGKTLKPIGYFLLGLVAVGGVVWLFRNHLPAQAVGGVLGGVIITVLGTPVLITIFFLLHKTKLVPGLFEVAPDVAPIDPDTLAARDILVRGAMAPAPSQTLLRAAQGGEQTPAEELLRAMNQNGQAGRPSAPHDDHTVERR